MPISDQQTLTSGDVVVVPFPCTDKLSEKRRPATVISGGEVHETGYIWLAMITSVTRAAVPFEVEIPNPGLAGLTAASRIRPLKIACTERSRIVRKIGCLDATTTKYVIVGVDRLLGSVTDNAMPLDRSAIDIG